MVPSFQIKDYQIQGVVTQYQNSTVFHVVNLHTLQNNLITQFRSTPSCQSLIESLVSLSHPNILANHQLFLHHSEQVLDCFMISPYYDSTLEQYLAATKGISMPRHTAMSISFQLFKALNHLNSKGIVHGHITPATILINTNTMKVVLAGLEQGGQNEAKGQNEFCYQGPEALFGGTLDYKVDMWAVTSILAEIILGEKLFEGYTRIEQVLELVRLLGTPTQEQLKEINPQINKIGFPVVRCHLLEDLFRSRSNGKVVELLRGVLNYQKQRMSPQQAMASSYYDELRSEYVALKAQLPRDLFEYGSEMPRRKRSVE